MTESVWSYPRPPRVEATPKEVEVRFNGQIVAKTTRALRVLETSHPPSYYIPLADVRQEFLEPSKRASYCEFKGHASYWSIRVGERLSPEACWGYREPAPRYAALNDHLAFYVSRMDECLVDGETVQAQPGDFYGGWITSDIEGPFKGGAGTSGW